MKEIALENLTQVIPRSLDEVLQTHRDQGQLSVATVDDLRALSGQSEPGPVKATLCRWQVLKLHLSLESLGHADVDRFFLVGVREDRRGYQMTSDIQCIDLDHGLVQTANSVYGITGDRGGESDLDLIYICSTLNYWGIGQQFGVAPFFF